MGEGGKFTLLLLLLVDPNTWGGGEWEQTYKCQKMPHGYMFISIAWKVQETGL